jgi:phosphoglycolate phosphatase
MHGYDYLMNYKTLIFDLDGTLINPSLGTVRCMNYALTTFDYVAKPAHEITALIGPPLEYAVKTLSGEDDELKIQRLVDAYRERYAEFGISENTVYPGIYDLLGYLTEKGIHLGVCTSKLEINAVKILNEFNLNEYFSFVSGSSGATFQERKADQLAKLLNEASIDSSALMIGDRAIDIEAARENQLQGCGVLWGFGERDELEKANPALIISEPSELIRVLGL